MSSKILQGGTAITWDEETESLRIRQASILIVNGRVQAIEEDSGRLGELAQTAEVIDVTGKIISPGFVSTHVHMWQTVFRTIGPDVVLAQYFDWLSQMSPTATKTFKPEDIYISCRQGYMEGLNGGTTSFVEHAHNNWSPDVVEPGLDAAIDSEARVWWCYDLAPRPNFSEPEQWKAVKKIAHTLEASSTVKLGLAIDSLAGSAVTGSPSQVEMVKHRVRQLDIEVITMHHMAGPWPSGQTSPTRICEQGLHELGIPIIFSHAPYLSDEDIRALRQHNLFVSITPESECHYGHGQFTGRAISDQASLGVDTNWTFSGDLLTQARLWLQTVRNANYSAVLQTGKLPRCNPMSVNEAFLMATRQGGLALGRKDIGVLCVGAVADIVIFNGDAPNLLGWSNAVAAVMLHANTGDIEHVLVGGGFRKRDFQLLDGRVGESSRLQEQFLESADRIQAQVKTPPELPATLWGIGQFGDVDVATTKRKSQQTSGDCC